MSISLILLLMIAVPAAILYVGRRRILRSAAGFLVRNETERQCDAIVLLNGNISTRAYRAVELYNKYPAPVLLARLADTEEVRLGVIPNISDTTGALLSRLGVANADVEILSSDRWVAGTRDEAILLCSHIRTHGWRSVAIVTDAFHTRRAKWTFRHVMRDDSVEFYCVATRFSVDLADRWWRSEYGLVQVVIEYIKFAHYVWLERADRDRPRPEAADLPPAAETRRYVAGYPPASSSEPD